jgi:hypothetical protein
MPYVIQKNFNDYSLVSLFSGKVYSKHKTLSRAKKEMEILKSLHEPNLTFLFYK